MEPIKINLSDYVLSGGGANGESYNHKTDPSVMLKLYFPGKIQQPLDEMLLARKVYDMGIPSPEPGEYVVTEDGRYGIRFRRILDKKSYSRATADNPEKVAQYQYSNAIFAGDKRYFIDLGDFCYGNHLFDVGMVYLCCNLSPEEFILETFHMPKSLAIEFWRNFAPEYFGDGLTFKEIEELIRPYAGLKTLIIERDTGGPMPVFREALKPIL